MPTSRVPDLARADLMMADLTNANLTDADLMYAQLTHAKLARANLSRVALRDTVFANIDLSKANGLDTCCHLARASSATEPSNSLDRFL
jgi:uncharacterized protein YjbI with pentapeptide repeats